MKRLSIILGSLSVFCFMTIIQALIILGANVTPLENKIGIELFLFGSLFTFATIGAFAKNDN